MHRRMHRATRHSSAGAMLRRRGIAARAAITARYLLVLRRLAAHADRCRIDVEAVHENPVARAVAQLDLAIALAHTQLRVRVDERTDRVDAARTAAARDAANREAAAGLAITAVAAGLGRSAG